MRSRNKSMTILSIFKGKQKQEESVWALGWFTSLKEIPIKGQNEKGI